VVAVEQAFQHCPQGTRPIQSVASRGRWPAPRASRRWATSPPRATRHRRCSDRDLKDPRSLFWAMQLAPGGEPRL
jgi:hypothetical protein